MNAFEDLSTTLQQFFVAMDARGFKPKVEQLQQIHFDIEEEDNFVKSKEKMHAIKNEIAYDEENKSAYLSNIFNNNKGE